MTAYNIVRTRVKRERQAEFVNANRELLFRGAPTLQGLRHLVGLHPSSTNYCLIGEWESYDALADARGLMAANLVEIRPMLEDLGGGLGVTYAVSGETLVEFTPTMVPLPQQGAPPHAYNVVRQRVKADRLKDYERSFRSAFDSFSTEAPAGLHKVAVVSLGARSYCIVGEWESFDHLAAARPRLINLLDGNRDHLEDLGGGLGVTYAVSGEAILEYRR